MINCYTKIKSARQPHGNGPSKAHLTTVIWVATGKVFCFHKYAHRRTDQYCYKPVLWLVLDLPDSVSWCMNGYRYLWWLLLQQWWWRRWWWRWLLLVVIHLLHLLLGWTPMFFSITIGDCHAWYDILPLPCGHPPGWRWLRAIAHTARIPVC